MSMLFEYFFFNILFQLALRLQNKDILLFMAMSVRLVTPIRFHTKKRSYQKIINLSELVSKAGEANPVGIDFWPFRKK